MQVYTVHLRRRPPKPDNDLVLIKEGFCWPAFFLTVGWALWHRLWLVAGLMLVIDIALTGLAETAHLHPVVQVAVQLGWLVVLGFVANDLRRRTLKQRGYDEMAVVMGADSDAAAQRYLDFSPRSAEVAHQP